MCLYSRHGVVATTVVEMKCSFLVFPFLRQYLLQTFPLPSLLQLDESHSTEPSLRSLSCRSDENDSENSRFRFPSLFSPLSRLAGLLRSLPLHCRRLCLHSPRLVALFVVSLLVRILLTARPGLEAALLPLSSLPLAPHYNANRFRDPPRRSQSSNPRSHPTTALTSNDDHFRLPRSDCNFPLDFNTYGNADRQRGRRRDVEQDERC